MAITTIERDGKTIYRYEYQTTLEDGTPVGGLQVAESEDRDSLLDAFANNQYSNLYRRNHQLMKERVTAPAPADAQKAAPFIKLASRALSPAERIALSKDLSDPDRIDSALDTAFSAKFGAAPSEIAAMVDNHAGNTEALRSAQEAAAWRENHPEFHATPKNANDVAAWVRDRGLKFTEANLQLAFQTLTDAALLEVAPPTGSQGNGLDAPAEPALTQQPVVEPAPSKIPTTPSRQIGQGTGAVAKPQMTKAQINAMSPAEYKKRLNDPKFVKAVNEVMA